VTTTPHGLARRSVGPAGLWVFGVSASAPMTVLAGGVVATYAATTGVVAVPLSYLVLTAVLWLFAIGYAALARQAPHAATFVALLAAGLGRTAAIGGAAVALLAYNSIQIALYGLLGATAAGLLGGPWWVWALAAWAVVAALGILGVSLNARIVAAVLAAELAMIITFDVVGLAHPADPDPAALLAPWRPDLFLVDGVGGVLAFGIAGFIGFESVTSYGEETRNPNALPRTLYSTLVFLGVLYSVSSWALAVAVGPDRIAEVARDPDTGIPFSVLAAQLGPLAATAGLTLLGLSIVGAMISFHQVVGRYLYALGREGVLPARLGITGGPGPGGVPTAASVAQSTLALAAIGAFAVVRADPLTVMFTWLATLSAIAVMTLMIAASVGVIGARLSDTHLRSAGGRARGVAVAGVAAVAMAGVLVVTVTNLDATAGDATGQAGWWLGGTVALTAAAGVGWARWLRRHRPAAYAVAGTGQPRPLAIRDGALRGLPL
jgi:amino acid transporter